MKFYSIIFLSALVIISSRSYCQTGRNVSAKNFIEAKILDTANAASLAYANIFNLNTKRGTISNDEGFIRIEINSPEDTLDVSYIGYAVRHIAAHEIKDAGIIFLKRNPVLLKEATVVADASSFLYDMLSACKKPSASKKKTAKTYFELETFKDSTQIELIVCYYNGHFTGYNVNEPEFKTGRLALAEIDGKLFVSTESSKAIYMLTLFDDNDNFPKNPFQLKKKAFREYYQLSLAEKYKDEKSNVIYVIDFFPRSDAGIFFNGRVWIDSLKNEIIKINLKAENALRHPFLPLWTTDSLKRVDLEITETFNEIDGTMFFNHVDYNYTIQYKSRNDSVYEITTKAVLYAYDYRNNFPLPHFQFSDFKNTDYRKIIAVPYNRFFWEHNDEYKLNDKKNRNEQFFTKKEVINNIRFTEDAQKSFRIGFFERPYLIWNGARIHFAYTLGDSTNAISKDDLKKTPAERYNLKVQLYMDVNLYHDSLNILTATVFDPFQSYYHFPFDTLADCFLNLYFDVMEIERREFEKEIHEQKLSIELINDAYQRKIKENESISRSYFSSVERGNNRKELLKWNEHVFEELRIDNCKLFNQYDK
ncbi:MAG TPA: hypothetical protein VI757_14015 [Bacteroidia bacterium]|nr:hypothetical protein [Bacteroidia bacterium]